MGRLPAAPPESSPFFIPTPVLVAAILVSAVVCFLLARNLASPLKRVREASGRLASGDLAARAGAMVHPRRDEIGDLVRDFDAMAERLCLLVSTQKQLLSDISHELRSPLARLQVAVELARRKTGPDAEKELNRIEAEGTRMNEMIGQILSLARAGSEQPAISETLDLAEIVRAVANDTDYEARRTDRAVQVQHAAQAVVRGDAALLASALENVVRNGCRYTAPRTSVDISLDVTLTHGRIVVRDHGPGVPASELERIFLPFHRVGPRAIAIRAERGLACQSPRAQPQFTADRSARPMPTASDSKCPSTFRFTKLYVRFPFLDGTTSRALVLWSC